MLSKEEGRQLAAELVQLIEKWVSTLIEDWEPIATEQISTTKPLFRTEIARFCVYQLKRELASLRSERRLFEPAWDHIRVRLELLSVEAEKNLYQPLRANSGFSAESEFALELKKYLRTKPVSELQVTVREIQNEVHELAVAYWEFTTSLSRRKFGESERKHAFSPGECAIELNPPRSSIPTPQLRRHPFSPDAPTTKLPLRIYKRRRSVGRTGT